MKVSPPPHAATVTPSPNRADSSLKAYTLGSSSLLTRASYSARISRARLIDAAPPSAPSVARVAFPEYEPTRRYERRWRSGDATPPAARSSRGSDSRTSDHEQLASAASCARATPSVDGTAVRLTAAGERHVSHSLSAVALQNGSGRHASGFDESVTLAATATAALASRSAASSTPQPQHSSSGPHSRR